MKYTHTQNRVHKQVCNKRNISPNHKEERENERAWG